MNNSHSENSLWLLFCLYDIKELFYKSAFFKQNFDVGALGLFQENLEHAFLCEGQADLTERLFVDGIIAGAQEFAHIVFAAPDFRSSRV